MLPLRLHSFVRMLVAFSVTVFFVISMLPDNGDAHQVSHDLTSDLEQHVDRSELGDLLAMCHPGLDCISTAVAVRSISFPSFLRVGTRIKPAPIKTSKASWEPVTDGPPPRV